MVGQPGAAPMGTFTYDPDGDRWTWSDELYAMHGFVPGEVVPTSALVEAHRHPDDRAAVRALLDEALTGGRPCGGQHRLVDAGGRERWVALLVEPRATASGRRLDGRVLDLTVPHTRSSAALATSMLAAATASRTVIDEAKGALMLAYGLDDDAAFGLLRWYSQHTNLKLRTLAERLIDAATGRPLLPTAARRGLDEVLSDVTVTGSSTGTPAGMVGAAASHRVGAVRAAGGAGALTTHRVQLPGATLLRVAGEVDLHSAPELAAALADAAAGTDAPHPVVVDLSEVTHLGPAGIAQLVSSHRRCQDAGTRLRIVVGPDGPVLPDDAHGLDVFGDLASAAA